MAACAVSLFAYGQYAGQGSGDAVVIESIAEVPAQPQAARFTFTNAHAARGLTGSAQRSRRPGPGAARIGYHVMPLVPPRWQREQPVPAWAACVAATGSECLREIDDMERHDARACGRSRSLPGGGCGRREEATG